MSIVGVITGIGITVIVLAVTYPLACLISGADEVIKRCEEMKDWAKEQMDRGERE